MAAVPPTCAPRAGAWGSDSNYTLHVRTSSYVFSGGGTGGHLYPGLAVAAALHIRAPEAKFTFFTTRRPLDRELLSRSGFDQIEQPVRPFSARPWHWPQFWSAWRRSVNLASQILQQQRPRAVLGLGGYAAAPPVVAARRLGIPTAILNPDAIPGKANRFLARRADLVVVQWEDSKQHFSGHPDCRAIGCPIRAAFAAPNPQSARRSLALHDQRPLLLVTAGSLGARSVNEAVMLAWPRFLRAHPDWQLVHVTGAKDEAMVRDSYARSAAATVLAYTHEMPDLLAAADLVVARAGASTLAELTALGRPAVLFPYPYHRDRHQHANAGVLVRAGAAILLEDTRDGTANAALLQPVLARLADPRIRLPLAQAAAALGRPRAADSVAEWMVSR